MKDVAFALVVFLVIAGPTIAVARWPVGRRLERWAIRLAGPTASKATIRTVGLALLVVPITVMFAFIFFELGF